MSSNFNLPEGGGYVGSPKELEYQKLLQELKDWKDGRRYYLSCLNSVKASDKVVRREIERGLKECEIRIIVIEQMMKALL